MLYSPGNPKMYAKVCVSHKMFAQILIFFDGPGPAYTWLFNFHTLGPTDVCLLRSNCGPYTFIKGQRDKGTKGQRGKGTKGQRDKGTKGLWNFGTLDF